MNNKPLDLTKPLQLRDGRKVRLLCTDLLSTYSVVAAAKDEDGNEEVVYLTPDGKYFSGSELEHRCDLINTPTRIKRDVWINVYSGGEVYVYSKKVDADTMASVDRLACVKVAIDAEEGEGL